MPIRMLLSNFRGQNPETENAGGSRSTAMSNAVTNQLNLGGIPISNTLSSSRANSNGARSGNLNEQFNIGGLGLNVGLASDQFGTGIGLNRNPGQAGLHIGALNLGVGRANTQTQTNAAATATGDDARSQSASDQRSRNFNLGLLNVQNTLSHSQSDAYSQNGQTSANAGANTATQQQTQQPNNYGQNQYYPPGINNNFSIYFFDMNMFLKIKSNKFEHFR